MFQFLFPPFVSFPPFLLLNCVSLVNHCLCVWDVCLASDLIKLQCLCPENMTWLFKIITMQKEACSFSWTRGKLTKWITLAYVKAQLKSAIHFHNNCKWGRHLYFATHTKTAMDGLMDVWNQYTSTWVFLIFDMHGGQERQMCDTIWKHNFIFEPHAGVTMENTICCYVKFFTWSRPAENDHQLIALVLQTTTSLVSSHCSNNPLFQLQQAATFQVTSSRQTEWATTWWTQWSTL